jgi:hypothetical protein
MNLILALVWLVAALAVLGLDYLGPGSGWRIAGTNLSFGWLMLALALYNLVRWWSIRSNEAARRAQAVPPSYRRHFIPPRDEPPDPNFDFGSEPPPREG